MRCTSPVRFNDEPFADKIDEGPYVLAGITTICAIAIFVLLARQDEAEAAVRASYSEKTETQEEVRGL